MLAFLAVCSSLFICVAFAMPVARNKSLSVDSPEFLSHFPPAAKIWLKDTEVYAWAWVPYPLKDIITRIDIWIIPLIIMIGSFQFAPLRFLNTIFVGMHIFADPLTSIYNLLSKLSFQQDLHKMCQDSNIPENAKGSVAILLAAYADWNSYLAYLSINFDDESFKSPKTAREAKEALENLLSDSADRDIYDDRINECQLAARELSDCHRNSIGKTVIGTINYLSALGMAFLHVKKQELNNRVGHSLAFGVLWTGILVIIWLSAINGSFVTKRSARTVLSRLQRHFDKLEEDADHRNPERIHREEHRDRELAPINQTSAIFTFHLLDSSDIKSAYRTSEGFGMNYCTTPSPVASDGRRITLILMAFLPVCIATGAAICISYTSPTEGVSCRNVQQLAFFCAWCASATISILIRHFVKGERQLWITRIKDLVITLAFLAFFLMGFIGWFNSPYCWGAQISRGRAGYIWPDPVVRALMAERFKNLWPTITFTVLGSHLLLILISLIWLADGARIYMIDDDEHEDWHNKSRIEGRRESLPATRGRRSDDRFL